MTLLDALTATVLAGCVGQVMETLTTTGADIITFVPPDISKHFTCWPSHAGHLSCTKPPPLHPLLLFSTSPAGAIRIHSLVFVSLAEL